MNPNCGRHQATMQLNEDVRIVRGNRNAHGRYAYIQQYWHFVEHNIAHLQITVSQNRMFQSKMIQLLSIITNLSNNTYNLIVNTK